MDLVSFIFKSRIGFYFTGKGAFSRILGLIGFSFLAMFYGFFIGFSLNNYNYKESFSFEKLYLIKAVNVFVLISTLSRAYLPSYKPKQSFISAVYPVSTVKRFIIDLIVDFLFPYFLVLVLFLSVIKVFSSIYDLIFYMQSVLVLLSSHIIRRLIQTYAERRINALVFEKVMLVLCTSVSCFMLLENNILNLNHNMLSLALTAAAFISLLLIDYIFSSSAIERKKFQGSVLFEKGIFNTFSTVFIFRNKFARKSILVAFILKLLIIIADLIMLAGWNSHLFNNIYVVWLYISPLILYSYIYSNTWGFYRTLWLTVDKCTSGFKPLFLIQLRIMFIPFLIDFILASTYFLITGKDIFYGFLFYIISLFIIICLSVFSSVIAARFVERPLSFRANSSVGFRFLSVFLVMGLISVKYYPQAIWGLPLFIAGSLILLKLSFDRYEQYKYQMYDKLFKSGS